MRWRVRFMTLSGPFRELRREVHRDFAAASLAVEQHAEQSGYTGVAFVDEGFDEHRWTAQTPGGRGGRNIAYGEPIDPDYDPTEER